ncbi:hypothetical protein [Chromobacterium sphagni]|nr:hypothetical protein [Chromobacterium sphagni]
MSIQAAGASVDDAACGAARSLVLVHGTSIDAQGNLSHARSVLPIDARW